MIQWEDVTKFVKDIYNYNIERIPTLDNTPDKICQSICAFSNDIAGSFKSGYIIIGAKENGKLQGLNATDMMLEQIYSMQNNGNIFPYPQMEVQKFTLPDGDVIMIEVIPSEYPPVRYNGKVWIRVGNKKSIAYEAEEKKLIERRYKLARSFDSQPSFYLKLDSIDLSLIKEKYAPLALKKGVKFSDKNTKNILESIRLYDSRYNRPTNAALLLFGKETKSSFPGAFIRYARFEGETKSSKLIITKDINGNICDQINQIDTFLEENYSKEDIKISVIKELLINALMHRDYQSNTPIQIYEFCNHIEILNPGGLYGKVSPENFPNINDYRNPILAEAIKIMGNCNGISSGIISAQTKLNELGNYTLYFDWTLITGFKIVLKNRINNETNTVSILKKKKQLTKLNINSNLEDNNDSVKTPVNDTENKSKNNTINLLRLNRATQDILKIIKKNPGSSAPLIANKTGKSLPTIKRYLAELKSQNIIEFIGAPKNGGYFLK